LEEYIKSFSGVKSSCINVVTGSLLILYDGDKLKPKLAAIEQQLAEQAAKRI
jgi:hypothetical protein